MLTDRFLRHRRGARLSDEERGLLEGSISEVRALQPRQTIVRAGEPLSQSTMLVDGFMCRYLDNKNGMRQLVAVHVPGDFVDLHAYPLHMLDHDLATLTAATVAAVPHRALDTIIERCPGLSRKLWYSTLLDAAIHRAWLFRLGRLEAIARIAHFLCETSARLRAVGLSDGRRFALGITQADLGDICGLTSVHVNRVLRALREEQLVSFRSSLVEIQNPERLRQRGEFDPDYLYLDSDTSALPIPETR